MVRETTEPLNIRKMQPIEHRVVLIELVEGGGADRSSVIISVLSKSTCIVSCFSGTSLRLFCIGL